MDGFWEGGTIELAGATAGTTVNRDLGDLMVATHDHCDGLVGTMADTGVTIDIVGGCDAGKRVKDSYTHLVTLLA